MRESSDPSSRARDHMMQSATRYHRIQLVLGAAGLVISAAYLVAVIVSGIPQLLSLVAARVANPWWWRVAVVATAVGIGHALLAFPLGWVRGYVLPRRFGLLHQPFGAWLADRLKGAALSGAFTLVILEVIYGLIITTSLWWLGAAAIVTLGSALVAAIFPVWIMPLFYRGTRLTDDALRDRLLRLARRVGVPAVDVWVVDQSRKSRTANAGLVGLGKTRRIILFDTLTRDFPADEIESVLAHELAHHVHRDTWRGLGAQAALTVVTFWITDRVLRASAAALGFDGPADPAGVPWLALVLGALGLLALPLANTLSRRFERQADDFALATTGTPGAFIGAMERLGELNLAERRPPRLEEILLHSHPSLERRIARAEAKGSPREGLATTASL